MRGVALRDGRLVVRDDLPDPAPGFGQVLVQVKACGICGSDLHFARHGAEMVALMEQAEGLPDTGPPIDLGTDVFMGHEFAAEVLEVGPDTIGPAPGTLVTSIPVLLTTSGVRALAYANDLPGGYGERMLLSAPLLLEVPAGLDPRVAALTEPMAVGLHAVNRAGVEAGNGAVVLGCGPVGLSVVAALTLRGIDHVVAADFSPARRAMAERMGAHVVVDPGEEDAFAAWRRTGAGRGLVVFEAVGVPGTIDEVLRCAPPGTRVVVVGVCMQTDAVHPFYGIAKELSVQFVLGYTPGEFSDTLRHLAEGDLDAAAMVTGEVDLDGVPGAFADLADPDRHCKVVVVP